MKLKPELTVLGVAGLLILRSGGNGKASPNPDGQCQVNFYNCSIAEADE